MRVGQGINDRVVNMIELSNLKEVYLTNVPLFFPHHGYSPHRKTCSIIFNKNQDKTLIILAKHHIQQGVVEHTLDLKSMTWSRSATNLNHFGSLVVVKGMWYYFNVLNQYGWHGHAQRNLSAGSWRKGQSKLFPCGRGDTRTQSATDMRWEPIVHGACARQSWKRSKQIFMVNDWLGNSSQTFSARWDNSVVTTAL